MAASPVPPSSLLARGALPGLAYRRLEGRSPGIIFLSGLLDSRSNPKCQDLERLCRETGRAFVCFDYRGCGESEGSFEESRLGNWKEDSLAVLDELTCGPQVLVGVSMGGWLILLLAMERPDRVAGLVATGIGVDGFILYARGLPAEVRSQAQKSGRHTLHLGNPGESLALPWDFFLEAERHGLLERPSIPVACPVRLLHGLQDKIVPWQRSIQVSEQVESGDVRVVLLKNGEHTLMRPEERRVLRSIVQELLEEIQVTAEEEEEGQAEAPSMPPTLMTAQ